jgi:DNA-directed RNA polymerase specialized sigma subunit
MRQRKSQQIQDHIRSQCNKLDFSNKQNHRKYSNIWRLNNTLLKDQWVTEEIKKFLESNENENTAYQNLWDTAKAMLVESRLHKHKCIKLWV